MTIATRSLHDLEKHWAVDAIGSDQRERAFSTANAWLVRNAAGRQLHLSYIDAADDLSLIERTALAFEVAALEGVRYLLYPGTDDLTSQLREQAQAAAFQCFQLSQVLPIPEQLTLASWVGPLRQFVLAHHI